MNKLVLIAALAFTAAASFNVGAAQLSPGSQKTQAMYCFVYNGTRICTETGFPPHPPIVHL